MDGICLLISHGPTDTVVITNTMASVPALSVSTVVLLFPVFASLAFFTVATDGEVDNLKDGAHQRYVPVEEYIPHWVEAPSSLADYPLRSNRTVVDPWVYTDRLGLYKILLRATSGDPTLGRANNTANILWGLPVQHGWQFKSGRLMDFPNGTRCSHTRRGSSWNCISPFSWWASMNYYLSVLPFLGAVKAGLFSDWPHEIEILASLHHPQDYCTSLESCTTRFSSVVDDWEDFFDILKYRSSWSDPHFQSITGRDGDSFPPVPFPTLSPREQDIIAQLWVAHTNSLETALPLFSASLLPLMSEPEQKFGLSWANLISYIAAVDFVTDLNTTVGFQLKCLPQRVLHQGDRPPKIPDFSWNVNKALLILETAQDIDRSTGDALKHAWQALMCSPASQARGRYMMANPTLLATLWNIVTLLWLYITECL
ncbi:protein LEG1 homolog [Acanthaster planci]|uniref:Protein LEG1 homolog n=1 Tax=Acanthaster planci TaxID=133434 RepID=A0A8B7XUI3_ACAPL|nr:protein LEG1 homolog [Acanthaster planci]